MSDSDAAAYIWLARLAIRHHRHTRRRRDFPFHPQTRTRGVPPWGWSPDPRRGGGNWKKRKSASPTGSDGVLGDIVSLLPTTDGIRTQVLSSRWRRIWRSAPLNIDLHDHEDDPDGGRHLQGGHIPLVLYVHPGPSRRFVLHRRFMCYDTDETLDEWLRSRALNNLQELEFPHVAGLSFLRPPLPASVHRFSSTLRVASFGGCSFPADGNSAAGSALSFPVLRQMTLWDVRISESSLQSLLTGCPVLESFLINQFVHTRLQIVSSSLTSIGVHYPRGHSDRLASIVIEDAPFLERLLYFGPIWVDISVISAPRLVILGDLYHNDPRFGSDTTFFQGSTVVSMTAVLPSVKILSLCHVHICLDVAINLVKCFPRLERLYIKEETLRMMKRAPYHKCENLIHTPDIGVRKIVLINYEGIMSHIDFVKLFLSNSRVLESLRLELEDKNNVSDVWIAEQHELLDIESRASRGARIDFVSPNIWNVPFDDYLLVAKQQVHNLSTEPFQRFH